MATIFRIKVILTRVQKTTPYVFSALRIFSLILHIVYHNWKVDKVLDLHMLHSEIYNTVFVLKLLKLPLGISLNVLKNVDRRCGHVTRSVLIWQHLWSGSAHWLLVWRCSISNSWKKEVNNYVHSHTGEMCLAIVDAGNYWSLLFIMAGVIMWGVTPKYQM
jgi:hypothetical protein